ncbi:uncharacterized protein LOC105421010 [Amborella trichopoda]|uniref:uncharacterized protein LOC105421010 n=1 Tax=Amborella trichopoda TaxID=13333 RepID=UPI0005D324AA|nr:uncharacterized protein LOC105421010 [Amborella trichopoda]|eukprot:XP_011625095.1 uncharacterized protein LOC105421010 [Amborella trichopoda]
MTRTHANIVSSSNESIDVFGEERKEAEFIELQQGRLSVEQCVVKFAELSHYAPHIINMERRKASKFERGLRSDIRGRVVSANLKMFSPLVDLAMKIEKDCEDFWLRKEGKARSMPSGNVKRKTQPPLGRGSEGRTNQGNPKIQRTLPGDVRDTRGLGFSHCGMHNHSTAECYKRMNTCFGCGKFGYLIEGCPMKGLEN